MIQEENGEETETWNGEEERGSETEEAQGTEREVQEEEKDALAPQDLDINKQPSKSFFRSLLLVRMRIRLSSWR